MLSNAIVNRRSLPRRALLAFGLLLVITAPLNPLAQARDLGAPAAPVIPQLNANPKVTQIWEATDGPVANGSVSRAWVWGAAPVAITVEHYDDSPTALRDMVYYDKGRLDILNPAENPFSPWFVTPASLVREMLAGEVQFGARSSVARTAPAIPVVGDLDQPDPLTYATLADVATLDRKPAAELTPEARLEANMFDDASSAVGRPITALINPRGTITPDGASDATIAVGDYDNLTRHNIAAPFAAWSEAQPLPPLYLLGHPLTEPYWIDTVVLGTPQRILFQAFERRILTYTPGNPEGWQVESGNVGLHYRLWRNLAQPTDLSLVPLAGSVPFGEEIVAAATANLVDPHLMVAIALTASNGDPAAELPNGGRGLMGLQPAAAIAHGVRTIRPDAAEEEALLQEATSVALERIREQDEQAAALVDEETPLAEATGAELVAARVRAADALATVDDVMTDPGLNAAYAARELAQWNPLSLDFTEIVADYYTSGAGATDDAALAAFVEQVVATRAELLSKYPPAALPAPGTVPGQLLGTGHAAYYSPSYDVAWWERTLRLYESWGNIDPGWQDDPNGFYCVRPGYTVGMRLQLVANGVTITCTIGDMVAEPHLGSWLAHWVVEMNWPAFVALGLDRNNTVEVYHIDPNDPPALPEVPTETPTDEPTPTEEPVEETPADPGEETPVVETPTPEPTETPEPEPTWQPVESPTPTPEPTATSESSPIWIPIPTLAPGG